MGSHIGGVNEEVIHVNNNPPFCNHIAKRVVHKTLEGGGGISETEEHHCRFKESFVGNEGGFPLMSIFDSDIIVSPSDIKLGEEFRPLEFIDEVRDERERVCITDGMFIDIAIVLTGSEAAIFLFNEEERRRCGELEGRILPVFRFSSRKSSVAFRSSGEREYTLPILGLKNSSRLIS